MTDFELLRRYLEGSQGAFTELVGRHMDLVHTAAMRQLRDPHLAEDVSQRVFLILAKKARAVRRERSLGAWLYNATRYACLDALKQRDRRRRHERKAAEMATRENRERGSARGENADWDNVEPMLDAAMSGLSGTDRQLLVMRYWESRTTDEVAGTLNVSSDAAKKRVSRALERLREQLARLGVNSTSETLAPLLLANVVKPAPAGLALKTAAAVSAGVGAGTLGGAGLAKGAVAVMAWTKAKMVAIGVVALCVVGGGAYVVSTQVKPTKEIVIAPGEGHLSDAPNIATSSAGSEWRRRFETTYALAPGQVVKRVPPPFIVERKMYWQSEVKDMARMMPDTDGMWMKFGFDGKTQFQSCAVGNPTVGTALDSAVGMRPYEVEGSIDPWSVPFPGDLVVREGTTREQRLGAIEPLVSEAMGRTVHFEKRHVTRDAIVMTGDYHPIPAKERRNSPYETVDIGVDSKPGKQYSTSATFDSFRGAIELMLRIRVVDERASKPVAMVTFRNNNVTPAVAKDPQKLESLLSNVSRQTGLKFAVEPRELDVWVMNVGEGSASRPVVMDR